MRKPLHLPPLAAAASSLLADFICTPVSMRGDRFFGTVRDLHAAGAAGFPPGLIESRLGRPFGVSPLTPANLSAASAAMETDDEPYPWELPMYCVEDGLATVTVSGPCVKGYDPFICWYFGLLSTDRLQETLAELAADANIRAVLLKLNCPGGVSTGMPETADMIVDLDRQKPVFGFTSDLAASNGYRLAAACRTIVTTRSACLGSIGTYIAMYDYSDYLKELGIKLELYRDGALKGIGLMGKTNSAEEKKFLQDSVDRCGAMFKDFVRAQRAGVKEETMQGQWFDGEQAVQLGLADHLVTTEAELVTEIRSGLLAA